MENKTSSIKERVVFLIEHEKIAKEVFFKKIGITSANFRGKAKDSPLNSTTIVNIFAEFPNISLEWLLTGNGNMYKNDENTANQREGMGNFRWVPLISMDLVGRDLSMCDPKYIQKMIPFLGAQENDICFPIAGNNMLPTYFPGSIVLAREVKDWRGYFGYGDVYCILLTDGRRILKEVRGSNENPKEYVLCVSHNENIAAEELPRNMIFRVWKVVQVLLPENW